MSRSIHETWRQWKRERHCDYADDEKARARYGAIEAAMARKRCVKRQVREGRALVQPDLPTLPETVPIITRDEGPYVHYPASEADVSAVLARLPRGSIDGLASVTLCLGAGEQDEDAADWNPDPLTGRRGGEMIPDVWGGYCLGVYWERPASIRLFGYVYDAAALPDLPVWELWLRLRMLSTLAHEVGHHLDRMQRVARGRWRMDAKWRNEMFAEARQQEWVLGVVVPYLKEAYPEEVRALRSWVRRHGGIDLPLADLAGEARTTAGPGRTREAGFFNLKFAVANLASDVRDGETPSATRTQFACELHYVGRYDEALGILGRVLRDDPGHLEAVRLKADIFVHKERYAEAAAIAERLVRDAPGDAEALDTLCDAYEGLEHWRKLLPAATRMMALGDSSAALFHARRQRTRALMHLGRLAEAEAEIAALAQNTRSYRQRHIESLRAELAELRSLPA